MSVDIKSLSVKELGDLIVQAQKRIEELKRSQVSDLKRKLEAEARSAGFDIYDLFVKGAAPARAAGGKGGAGRTVPPKYRNPGNASQTWTGRGKQPLWVRDALAGGKSLQDLLIG